MKQSIKNEKQQYDEELDLLYRKGLIEIDELDDMQRQKRNAQEKKYSRKCINSIYIFL